MNNKKLEENNENISKSVWITDGFVFFYLLCPTFQFFQVFINFIKRKVTDTKGKKEKKGSPIGSNFPYASQFYT